MALIPELDFEIGMTASCSENSELSDESPLFDYVDCFESTWVVTILRGRSGVGQLHFTLELVQKRKKEKTENQQFSGGMA